MLRVRFDKYVKTIFHNRLEYHSMALNRREGQGDEVNEGYGIVTNDL